MVVQFVLMLHCDDVVDGVVTYALMLYNYYVVCDVSLWFYYDVDDGGLVVGDDS